MSAMEFYNALLNKNGHRATRTTGIPSFHHSLLTTAFSISHPCQIKFDKRADKDYHQNKNDLFKYLTSHKLQLERNTGSQMCIIV